MGKSLKLLALLAVLPVPAMAQEWSVEIYGGQVQSRSEDFGVGGGGSPIDRISSLVANGLTVAQSSSLARIDARDVDSGQAFGLGIYVDGLVGPFQIGLDLMRTKADYADTIAPGGTVQSLSAMLVGRYDFPLGEASSAYVGAGLGAIRVEFERSGNVSELSGSDTVAGGQISLGLRHKVGNAGHVFGEVKRQVAFGGPMEFENSLIPIGGAFTTQQSYASTSILIGFGLNF